MMNLLISNWARIMDGLLKWEMHDSERYHVKGNIGLCVTITDKKENKSYRIEYSEMITFRKHWENIKRKNRDIFLTTLIVGKGK